MRKLFVCSGVLCLFSAAALCAVFGAPNFSGTWVLDKSKSEGLESRFGTIESITMVVNHTDSQLSVESTEVREGRPPAPAQKLVYDLSGHETTADLAGRMPMKATLKAKWSGETLELDQVRTGNFQGNDFTMNFGEKWSLDASGILTVHRTIETPMGTRESKLVFTKK